MFIEDASNIDLSKFIIAEVRNNVDPDMEGKIAVYIPQLMYEYNYDEKPYRETTSIQLNSELIINSNDFENKELEIETSNYIWARPLSYFEDNEPNWKHNEKFYNAGSLRVPRVGTQVIVIFINSDVQKCYYLPYTPTVSKNKLDDVNCCNQKNFTTEETRPNVDVIRLYWDGMRIEADTNSHEIKLASPNGNYILLSDKGIEMKGNIHVVNDVVIDGKTNLKNSVTIDDLVTCRNQLKVQGTIYNAEKNLSTHTHYCPDGSTSRPL